MGNLDAERDWGYAGDYVRAMWLMLRRDEPTDYVVATGIAHSVRDLCQIAFKRVGLDYREHVVVDPSLYRPAEVDHLRGDASRAREELGWSPTMTFKDLIELMVDADLERLKTGAPPLAAEATQSKR
jgi:GDPmannose 4,6-dehydratase